MKEGKLFLVDQYEQWELRPNFILSWGSHKYTFEQATKEQLIKSLISVASDLIYLHDDCQHPLIIHEGIKSRNIMLDAEMNACLGDFGLARSVEEGSSHYTSKVILVSCLMCVP